VNYASVKFKLKSYRILNYLIFYRRSDDQIIQYRLLLLMVGMTVLLQSCGTGSNFERILERPFGSLDDGREVRIFSLRNARGTEVEIMDLGAIIVSLNTVDAHGNISDITLGYDEPQQYLDANAYMGAVVGRYGNRIAEGKFSIDGQDYTLASNNGPNALHGGIVGFDKKMWKTSIHSDNSSATVSLDLISEDGEEGYPGTLSTNVSYTLTDGNRLIIDYSATTDKATVINLTQHAYFNLDGHNAGSILEHEVLINADQFTPANIESIPTGEIASVVGTPFDFRVAKKNWPRY
jgi:aldose 1-epimerase